LLDVNTSKNIVSGFNDTTYNFVRCPCTLDPAYPSVSSLSENLNGNLIGQHTVDLLVNDDDGSDWSYGYN